MMPAGAVMPILTITALMKMTGMMTMRPAAVILLLLVLLIVLAISRGRSLHIAGNAVAWIGFVSPLPLSMI